MGLNNVVQEHTQHNYPRIPQDSKIKSIYDVYKKQGFNPENIPVLSEDWRPYIELRLLVPLGEGALDLSGLLQQ